MDSTTKNTQSDRGGISRIISALFVLASMIWVFFELADAVIENETHRFDTLVMLAFRNPADFSDPLGPVWVEELARDITALGGVGILTFLALSSAGFLWLQGQQRLTGLLLVAVTTGISLSQMLKSGFDRPRPELVSHESAVYTASFPSGHSLMAAIVYLTLAVLLARTLDSRTAKAYVITLATFVVIAVGVSRVYLGVHWPTDVLAGWIVGAAWALLCGVIASWLARRGRLEGETTARD
ncbi:undecaprenyl-diphosphatase [Litoreibacter halocynthiae]|uniref:Undecaprenyl-diphosphatase n=1 Tax=Litoreibacter halocynthiae TaxID=1242689 RepID=A0A4R7LUQ4_9RHOB|nr:phosphatase PAP2 family protein [Litoreibacter halocynthiae]TDT77970.1 undecaprenyl-diphosphatase [Litoreibacter halocynthiae]